MREHGLSFKLGILGCIFGVIGLILTPIAAIACFTSFLQNVTINPPEAINPIIEAGYGFIFTKWFWSTAFLSAVLMQVIGFYTHPEAQLERKLRDDAVRKFKQENEWPWK